MDVPPLEFPENDIDKLVDCLGKKFGPFQHKTAAIKKPRKYTVAIKQIKLVCFLQRGCDLSESQVSSFWMFSKL